MIETRLLKNVEIFFQKIEIFSCKVYIQTHKSNYDINS